MEENAVEWYDNYMFSVMKRAIEPEHSLLTVIELSV